MSFVQASPTTPPQTEAMRQDPTSPSVGVQVSIDARAATWAVVDLQHAFFDKPVHEYSATSAAIPLLRTLSDEVNLVSPISIYKRCFTLAQVAHGLLAAEAATLGLNEGINQGSHYGRAYEPIGSLVSVYIVHSVSVYLCGYACVCVLVPGTQKLAPKGTRAYMRYKR
jgi:hypothetical protein